MPVIGIVITLVVKEEEEEAKNLSRIMDSHDMIYWVY